MPHTYTPMLQGDAGCDSIIPLSVTTPNWPEYIHFVQKHLGHSPTRGIDLIGISPQSAQGFLLTLDLHNQARTVETNISSLYNHVSCSFICVTTHKIALDLAVAGLTLQWYDMDDYDCILLLMTATVNMWISVLNMKFNKRTTELMNKIYDLFIKMNYTSITSKVK